MRSWSAFASPAPAGYSEPVSVIVSEVYDALLEAGASEEKANAAAAAIPPGGQVATRADIARLEADVKVLRAVYGPITIGLLPSIVGMVFKLVFFP